MAKLVQTLHGDFDEILHRIEAGIVGGSVSASMEAKHDFSDGAARCSVRVFERYSYWGSNRVSLNVTLFQGESGAVRICAVAAGGSQAVFFKLNTFGEEAFLEKLRQIIEY